MNKKNKIKEIYSSLSITKKAIIWFTLATIIQNAILFLVTPLYTRILTDEQYGVFSVYQSWQQIISIIAILALDRCITVGFIKFKENRKEFLSSVQALMTVLVMLFVIIIVIFGDFFEKLINLPMYIIIAMFIVALMNNTLANWSWYQRYTYSYKKLALVTILSTIIIQVMSVLAIIYLPFENKGNVLVMSMAVGKLILYGIIYISVYINGNMFFRKEYWKFALKYSIAIVPHALAQIVLNSSDRIMIDKICGRADAAYYGVTYSAAMVLNIIMNSINSAVQPWFFDKIRQKDFESIKKQTNILLIISAALSIGVSLFAPEILKIMAPSSYSNALWVFPSVAGSIFFYSMYLYFSNFESYYEKPVYFSIATTIGAIVNIVLNLIFIPKFGFVVAGYTTLICYMLFAIMHYIFMKKICSEKLNNIKVFDSRFIIKLSIIVIVLIIIVTILYNFIIIRYLLVIMCIIIILIKHELIIGELKKLLSLKK